MDRSGSMGISSVESLVCLGASVEERSRKMVDLVPIATPSVAVSHMSMLLRQIHHTCRTGTDGPGAMADSVAIRNLCAQSKTCGLQSFGPPVETHTIGPTNTDTLCLARK